MKKFLGRSLIILALLVAILTGLRLTKAERSVSATHSSPLDQPSAVVVACPGRLEGRTRAIAVGAAIDGVVESIRVHEGQSVARGAILAEIGCRDLKAALQVARAEAEGLTYTRARLLRGSREEQRQVAAQKTHAARAIMEQASTQADREQKLWDAAAVSRAVFDEARRDFQVAEAGLKEATRNEELVNAPPLEEDVARADSDIAAAGRRIEPAADRLDKCVVRAPIDGTILHAHLREGESFALLAPRPLFSLADTSRSRVRAEVDERDIAKVHVGQPVIVTSDAFPDRRFRGTVLELSSMMGRKSVVTGNPADKSDSDVLEVVAELEPGATQMPLGLRVTVRFLP